MLDRNFFIKLQQLPAGAENKVLTVLEGQYKGAKALLSAGEVVWQRGKDFLRQNVEQAGLFTDCLYGERELVICGAGTVALALISLAKRLEFNITVLEDRREFAAAARDAGADRVICAGFAEALKQVAGDDNTYFVVMTREHQYDALCLQVIMQKESAYVGVMGSRRRTELLRQELLEQGISRAVVDRLHAPIGLAIGAETEMEIAVSVMAEIIKTSNYKNSFPAKLCAAALKAKQPFVLATIISRQGSAPRDIGTKMLIFADTIVASIGGGTLEARIIKRGRKMLAGKETKDVWEKVDLTGAHQEAGYMLCGGMVDVLLEYVDPEGKNEGEMA